MYVRLSDGAPVKVAKKNPSEDFPFIYLPDMRAYVREDYLDDLDDSEWRALMAQIAASQPSVESGAQTRAQFMADKATRKQRREERRNKKQTKTEQKEDKRSAKNEIRKARAQAKREGRGADVLGSVMNGVKSFIGMQTGADAGGGAALPPEEYEEATPWYKTTGGAIGIAAGAAILIGGGIYLARK